VNTLYVDREQNLWVGGATGLYWRNAAGDWARFTEEHGLPHDFVGRIVAGGGRLWLCTRHGLARVVSNPRAGHAVVDLSLTDADGLPHRDVRDVRFTLDGSRWVATMGGLAEWSGAAGFHVYMESNGLTDRAVYAIAEDPQGSLWLGTRRGGLMRLNSTGFRTFGAADGLDFSGDDKVAETRSGDSALTQGMSLISPQTIQSVLKRNFSHNRNPSFDWNAHLLCWKLLAPLTA
jgi:ligand-binding sensor domain-containing protein